MLEQKAKTLWCPIYTAAQMIAGAMEPGGEHKRVPCEGGACPMWRWNWNGQNHRMDTGYCGLGGPEK